jgi:outer membrane lipoprotein-sorting protein
MLRELSVWVDDEFKIQRTEATLPKSDHITTTYRNQRPAPLPASTFEFTPPADAHVSQPLGK